ncbi:MAG: DNA-binding protein WhiA [Oscillospiraceae bacterium]|nr:DNA-binding protein WhiA [Oscillospiraceae bacterium]
MSFSSDIKDIICKTEYQCPGCMRAELAGFFVFPDKLSQDCVKYSLPSERAGARIGNALFDEFGTVQEFNGSKGIIHGAARLRDALSDEDVINECCKTAYIRGAFLSSGSVSNPEKDYHLEFATKSDKEAEFLMSVLKEYEFCPKITQRKNKNVIYIKESSQIADLIGYMTGGRAGLEIMSIQIEKELKSSAQRRVNCDSANLNKQAAASAKQITAIRRIKAARKWSAMPEVLREIGELRIKYPDVSIEALGKMTKQEIGKSGVNHRLKRIIEYADSLTEKERRRT